MMAGAAKSQRTAAVPAIALPGFLFLSRGNPHRGDSHVPADNLECVTRSVGCVLLAWRFYLGQFRVTSFGHPPHRSLQGCFV